MEEKIVATEEKTSEKLDITTTRKIMVVGCGDGGCNIAATIADAIPNNVFAITYNLSNRAMNMRTAHTRIWPIGVDGSGKVRSDATETFKKSTARRFMERAMEVLGKMDHCDYILVVGTADGGTGSGTVPTMAKLLADNVDIPVIIMGIYPSIGEDAMSQYNAIQWQQDVTKTGLPYIILDNDVPGTLTDVHAAVNGYAVEIARILTGEAYGNTDISIIDNRNLYMLINQVGGRIVISTNKGRLDVNSDMTNFIETKLLANDYQPAPSNVRGIGLFVKGPKDMIDRVDSSLVDFQSKYGQALLKFAHLEISNEPSVSILLSGCSEPSDRLRIMQSKYNDVTNATTNRVDVSKEMAASMANPLGAMKTGGKRGDTLNFSALEG